MCAIHGATVENTLFEDGDGSNTFRAFNPTQAEETYSMVTANCFGISVFRGRRYLPIHVFVPVAGLWASSIGVVGLALNLCGWGPINHRGNRESRCVSSVHRLPQTGLACLYCRADECIRNSYYRYLPPHETWVCSVVARSFADLLAASPLRMAPIEVRDQTGDTLWPVGVDFAWISQTRLLISVAHPGIGFWLNFCGEFPSLR